MNVLSRLAVLIFLITSCKKNLRDETVPLGTAGENRAVSTFSVYPIGSHLWSSMPVPDLGDYPANNASGSNRIIQVNGETLCLVGGNIISTYKYNQYTQDWHPLVDDEFFTSFGTGMQYFFSFGSKIFYGMHVGPDSISRRFLCFDLVARTSTLLAPFPGMRVSGPTSFIIGDKGYVLSGFNRESQSWINQCWEYNIVTNKWIDKGNSPIGARAAATALVLDNKVFIGLGYTTYNLNGQIITQHRNDWRVYYPGSGMSIQLANFPGEKRSHARGFVISGNPYLGFGSNEDAFFKDFWKYDISASSWIRLTDWPGATPVGTRNIGTFSLGKTGFVVKGNFSEFWRFSIP